MSKEPMWRSGEVLAYTEREGPGRPPRGPSIVSTVSLAVSMGIALIGLLSNDTLCPTHRVVVEVLAGVVVYGVVAAMIALFQAWSSAPLTTFIACLAAVAIGVIDAAHSTTLSRLIVVSFGAGATVAAALAWRARLLARWDPALRRPDLPAPHYAAETEAETESSEVETSDVETQN